MTKEALQCRMLSTALLWVFEGGNGEGPFCQDLALPRTGFMTIFYWGWQITIGKGVFQLYLGCFLTLHDLIQKLFNSLVYRLNRVLCM